MLKKLSAFGLAIYAFYTLFRIYKLFFPDEIIEAATITKDLQKVVFAGNLKVINIHEVDNKKNIKIEAHDDEILALILSNDEKYIVTGSSDKTVKIWDFNNIKQIKSFKNAKSAIRSVAISNDNKYVAAGDTKGYIYIWDVNNNKLIKSFKAHNDIITSIIFSNNSDKVISSSGDGKIKIWSLADFNPLKVLNNHKEAVLSLNISEDDSLIVSSSNDRSIVIYDLVTEKIVKKFYDEYVVTSVKFYGNNIIFYGNRNGEVKVIENLIVGTELVTKREHPVLNIVTNTNNKSLFVIDKEGVFDIIKFNDL